MHGDRDQEERNEALRLFKNKTHPVMVATDVLSRGIDIDDVSLIVNFDVPNNPEDYIHRIGRTGRYDKKGTAITFVSNKDKKYYHAIKNVVGDQLTVKDIPDESSSEGKRREKKEERSPQKKSRQQPEKKEKKEEKKKKPVSREESKFAKKSDKKKTDTKETKQEKETQKPEKKEEKQKPKQKKERKPRPSSSKGKSKKQKQSNNGKTGNKKSSPKKNDSARSGKNINIPNHIREAEQEEDIFQPEIIEKAVARNRRALKPSKGIWGVIKSMFPKF